MIPARQYAQRRLSPVARWLTQGSARVLMYHRFAPRVEHRRVAADVFEQQLRYVLRHFDPCRLDVLVERLREGRPSKRPVVAITVDDGYLDFLEVAYPILVRHGVPATVFVVSGFVDQAIWLWFDALRHLADHARTGRYRLQLAGRDLDIRIDGAADRETAWEMIADTCVPMSKATRAEAVRSVEKAFDVELPQVPTERYRAMTWDHLRQLDPALIEVGGHTCTHPILSWCSPSEIDFELAVSKETIERNLGRRVRSFCYPSGRPADYNDAVADGARRAGYDAAVVAHGTLVRPGASLLKLERLGAPAELRQFQNLVDGYPYLVERTRQRLYGSRG